MEQSRSPNFRRLAILFALFILLSAGLLFGARDLIRELVVLPLSYIVWTFQVLIKFTHQIYFWILILIYAVSIAYSTVWRKRKKAQPVLWTAAEPPESLAIRGRVNFWMTRVGYLQSERGDYLTRSFHSALGKMLLDLLAYRYRMTPKQVEARLQEGGLDIPQDIRNYALGSLRPAEGRGDTFFKDMWDKIVSIVQAAFFGLQRSVYRMAGAENRPIAWRESYPQPVSAEKEALVRRILEFMEEELEVPHDNAGR